MIHAKNGRGGSAKAQVQKAREEIQSKLANVNQLEEKVESWVKQNPLLGISLALALGVGIGLLVKRKLL